ncbi:MAG: hypothetical protein WAW52_02160 [Methanothrix sp.]
MQHHQISGLTGLPRPRARACTLACEPAWQTAAVSPDGLGLRAAPPTRPEGAGEKLSFSYRYFAASRETVISARLVPQHERLPGNPSRPCDIAPSPDGPGPQAATSSSRNPCGAKARPCGCPALLPVACKDRQAGDRHESLCQSFVPLWCGPELMDIFIRR